MPQYNVQIPINGCVVVTVEADSERDAISTALSCCDLELNPKSEKGYELMEWDVFSKLTEGNVFNGMCREADAEEVKG